MKIVTWLGTRPEIIRLSRVIPLLDANAEHTVVHTGQNYDPNLSDVFFREMAIRPPDVHLGIESSSFGAQAARIVEASFDYFSRERPDRVLILGDTNSGLAAISAARLRIPVYHMEAGNRCYDDRVPEEINRRIIDACSAVLMPYTHRSKDNLVREGIERRRIAVTGNPIFEVLSHYRPGIDASQALGRLGLAAKRFFLATLHRAENVDEPARLRSFLDALDAASSEHGFPAILSLHPRTAARMRESSIAVSSRVRLVEPLGFFDFVHLELTAACVLSDSGTVQEECCILGVPNVTLRDVTERAETIECGSNILSGSDPSTIASCVRLALSNSGWTPPDEYLHPNVSRTVVNVILGHPIA
jgi:UDP-N-acetylglucosamine 2-epimerase (non-hydrolysing)